MGLLDLRGAVVSTDAMGCQKAIAQTIIEAGADYVLALKDNHPALCEDVRLWLDTEVACGRLPAQETVKKDHGRIEIRRYVLSICSSVDQARFAATVRQHWGIENQQHWVLDVQFGEDACRTRRDHSAENLAVIRRMALNVLRHNGPSRDSIRRRKLRAALSDDYRLRLLLGQPSSATA